MTRTSKTAQKSLSSCDPQLRARMVLPKMVVSRTGSRLTIAHMMPILLKPIANRKEMTPGLSIKTSLVKAQPAPTRYIIDF